MPLNAEQIAQRMKAEERRTLVAGLLRSGTTQRSMVQALRAQGHEVGLTTVNNDVKRIFKELRNVSTERASDARELDLARLEEMLRGLWPNVLAGNPESIRAAIQVLGRRAKMLGYDEPTRIAHGGDDMAPEIRYVYRTGPKIDLSSLTEEQLDHLEELLQHQAPEADEDPEAGQ